MTRIGLLGGTFDPPHLGHLVVADGVRDALGLDEVRLLVAGDPWMKQRESSARHRVAMCRAAAKGDPGLAVDDRETRRAGHTYTADTLAELRTEHPDVAWTFVVGVDAAAHLPSWHRVQDALPLAEWAVVGRPGTGWPEHDLAHHLVRVDVPLIDISSTDLRARVAAGRSVRYLVPEPVRAYIAQHGLYGPAGE